MVRVRPTTLVGPLTHPDRRAFVVFRDYPGSWSDSNQPPECYGMRWCPTSFPQWRHHSIWVSAEGRLIDTAIFPRLSLTAKFGFPEQRTGGYGDAIGMRIRVSVRRFAKL